MIKARKAGLTLRGAGCFTSAGRVTMADGTLFSYVNTLSRPPETRQLEQKMREDAMTRACVS